MLHSASQKLVPTATPVERTLNSRTAKARIHEQARKYVSRTAKLTRPVSAFSSLMSDFFLSSFSSSFSSLMSLVFSGASVAVGLFGSSEEREKEQAEEMSYDVRRGAV